ncbi:hypothetical protein MSI_16230 [Treponema sp. JC4]|uniref:hypothetical protein n=1 Tax=Treponema sp. JC4 TaxID=1124982 RepID=UPI00025B0E20|nr:hypothetical protein [Treponema sp. JC4]EID84840.1 hypothetical protein MSI_16230 [Treponema sp. JC4]
MKKILLAVGLMFASVCAFANIELDENLYGNLGKTIAYKMYDVTDDNEGTLTAPFAFGSETDANFYFGSGAGKFDAGLGIYVNMDFFSKTEAKFSGITNTVTGSGFNLGAGIGPVFRITFANPFSLYIRPALGFNLYYFEADNETKQKFTEFDLFNINLNIGGRSWILNVDGFHLGIDYGFMVDLGAGFGTARSTYKTTYGTNEESQGFGAGAADFKIYAGLCLNFGDRGFDR